MVKPIKLLIKYVLHDWRFVAARVLISAGGFWLDDRRRAEIAPLLPRPTNQPGAHRTHNRHAISAIIHVLRSVGSEARLSGLLRVVNSRLKAISSPVCQWHMASFLGPDANGCSRHPRDRVHCRTSTLISLRLKGRADADPNGRSPGRKTTRFDRWLPPSRVANITWTERRRARCYSDACASASQPTLCRRHGLYGVLVNSTL
ncbi:hypothetical protein RHI9324_04631 [Rhizobium sp. CECT 9324]|nr:hypothetical protein RHI9324_04631 [Rhizobium sp. CECT 9324]